MNTKNKKSNPKISVIITCYNYGKFIDEAIQSVQNQTFKDLELIIIDDYSTDEFTQDKIKELSAQHYLYDSLVITLKENVGVSKARNLATEQAKGEYILYLDADDKIEADCLQKMYDKMQEGFDIVGSHILEINKKHIIKRESLWSPTSEMIPALRLSAPLLEHRVRTATSGAYSPRFLHSTRAAESDRL